jgi:hypothetical protein
MIAIPKRCAKNTRRHNWKFLKRVTKEEKRKLRFFTLDFSALVRF